MLSGLSGQAMPGWSDGKTVPEYGVIRLSGRFRFDHRTHRPGQKDAKLEEASSSVPRLPNPLHQVEHLRSLGECLSAKVRYCKHRIIYTSQRQLTPTRSGGGGWRSMRKLRQVGSYSIPRGREPGGNREGEGEKEIRRREERTDGRGRERERSRKLSSRSLV